MMLIAAEMKFSGQWGSSQLLIEAEVEVEVEVEAETKVEVESAPQILASKRHSRATQIFQLSITNYQLSINQLTSNQQIDVGTKVEVESAPQISQIFQ